MTNKVCPNCGCGLFYAKETIKREIIVDGNGNVYDNSEVTRIQREPQRACVSCDTVFSTDENLVSETYFHEVIAVRSAG